MKESLAVAFLPFSRYQEALSYLVYAYQSNAALLMKGPRRGVKESVIALYRRKCLLVCTPYKTLISPPSLPACLPPLVLLSHCIVPFLPLTS